MWASEAVLRQPAVMTRQPWRSIYFYGVFNLKEAVADLCTSLVLAELQGCLTAFLPLA